jgi:hypothetical protein
MNYYVNKHAQSNGDHEVHTQTCRFLPSEHNQKYLGDFSSCEPAVEEAKKTDPLADGCKFCSPSCHTR